MSVIIPLVVELKIRYVLSYSLLLINDLFLFFDAYVLVVFSLPFCGKACRLRNFPLFILQLIFSTYFIHSSLCLLLNL